MTALTSPEVSPSRSVRTGDFADRAPILFAATILAAIMIPVTLALHAADQRILDGEAVWLKPLKFQISMLVHGATLFLLSGLVDEGFRRRLWVRVPLGMVGVAMLYESVFLSIQAGRGVRSHFNDDTAFDAIGGAIMSYGAGLLVTGPFVLGLVILVRAGWTRRLTPLHLAAALGLVMGAGLAIWSGTYMGMNRGPFVGTHEMGDPALPLFGWSLVAGDYRIGHFFGLHTMQALPLAALALLGLPARAGYPAVLAVAAACGGLTAWASLSAHAGLPILGLPL